ncbi:hypothetical protein [Kitasatospora sp. NPDC057198]|uniref:effector-associated constant component EACC1 n=1 Tax=Kitasatospora sp. NPDC057198 TaxID=3346046 RepID=UPI003636A5A1
MTAASPEALSDRSVVLSLQEITEELGDTDPARTPLDADEAQSLVTALMAAGGERARTFGIAGEDGRRAARQLLVHLLQDPDTSSRAAEVLSDPPADEQMSVEAALVGTVLLGALVAWLQTKVDIRIHRRDGHTEFDFRLRKEAAPPGLLRELAATVARLLGGTRE